MLVNFKATWGVIKFENWTSRGWNIFNVQSNCICSRPAQSKVNRSTFTLRFVFRSDQLGATLLQKRRLIETVLGKKTGSHRRLSPPVSSLSYRGSCSPAGGRDLFVLEGGWKVKGRSGKEGRGRRPRALKGPLSRVFLSCADRTRTHLSILHRTERESMKRRRGRRVRRSETPETVMKQCERMRRSWGDVGDI